MSLFAWILGGVVGGALGCILRPNEWTRLPLSRCWA